MHQLPDDLHRDKDNDHWKESLSKSAALGLGFAWELGYTIAIPALLFGFGGAYVDKHLGTSPLLLMIGLILAFIGSFAAILRKVRTIIRQTPTDLPRKLSPVQKALEEGQEFHDAFRPKDPQK